MKPALSAFTSQRDLFCQAWEDDPLQAGRQIGLVTTSSEEDYAQPVIRIAVRCRKKNGQWAVGVLVTNLSPAQVAE